MIKFCNQLQIDDKLVLCISVILRKLYCQQQRRTKEKLKNRVIVRKVSLGDVKSIIVSHLADSRVHSCTEYTHKDSWMFHFKSINRKTGLKSAQSSFFSLVYSMHTMSVSMHLNCVLHQIENTRFYVQCPFISAYMYAIYYLSSLRTPPRRKLMDILPQRAINGPPCCNGQNSLHFSKIE